MNGGEAELVMTMGDEQSVEELTHPQPELRVGAGALLELGVDGSGVELMERSFGGRRRPVGELLDAHETFYL